MLKNISFNPIFLVDPIFFDDRIFFDDPIFLGESILKKKNWLDKRIRIGLKNRRFFESINTSSIYLELALKQVPNKSLPHTHEDYRIAGALINRFLKGLISDQNGDEEIVKNMKSKFNTYN